MLWYEKMRKPPEPGSLQEIFAQMVMVSKMEVETLRWLVLYKVLDEKDRFNHTDIEMLIRKPIFPYVEDLVKKSRQQVKQLLDGFAGQGPMVLSPDAVVGASAMKTDPSRPHAGMTPMGLIPRKPK